jgi:hypothetical protein
MTIPEHSSIERRIQRAYARMMSARSEAWAFAWADSLYRMVMRRRLEIPAQDRDSGAGTRQLALGGVVATSDGQTTRTLVDSPLGAE